jgi:hypothetical protein
MKSAAERAVLMPVEKAANVVGKSLPTTPFFSSNWPDRIGLTIERFETVRCVRASPQPTLLQI